MLRHVVYKRNEKDFATRVVEDDTTGAVTQYIGDAVAVTATTNPLTGGIEFDSVIASAIEAAADYSSAVAMVANTPGNVDAVDYVITANNARRARIGASSLAAQDVKINLVGAVQNGKSFQGFPSSVRLSDGSDLILYREGIGHTEQTPIASGAVLTAGIRSAGAISISSRNTVFSVAGVDPRDPSILRDNFGHAVLVGGMLKVIIFKYATDYSLSNCSAAVYDLDPGNVAAGLVNPVAIPSPIKAVKSDVRKLSDNTYGFVGYDISHNAYFVQTPDWSTFTSQLIGPGNESALCETADGMLNVISRSEENHGNRSTIFYKRQLSGGDWYVHDVLPYTLSAPTLVQLGGYNTPPVTNGNFGWGLFARDKTGRLALTPSLLPISNLVCFVSKNDYGRTIDTFVSRSVVAGLALPGVSPDGDAHYCSVIAGKKSGDLDIYTYGPLITSFDGADTSLVTSCYRVQATYDAVDGVRPERMSRINWIRNGDFRQGDAGYDIAAASASAVTIINDVVTGNPMMKVANTIAAGIGLLAIAPKGETLFPKIRLRTLSSNLANGRHIVLRLYDYSTGSAVLINTVYPELPTDIFDGRWHTVVLPPIVSTGRLYMSIDDESGITAAETHISNLVLSDDYTRDLPDPNPMRAIIARATVTFNGVPTGGQKAAAIYSNGFWALFGLVKRASGIPYGARSAADISVSLENITTNAGALRLIDVGTVVNVDGTITANLAVAPGETGTIGATVSASALVTITTPDYPFGL